MIFRVVTLVLFITHSFGLNGISISNGYFSPIKINPSIETFEESWNEGEVAWDIDPAKDEAKVVLLDKPRKQKRKKGHEQPTTNREKIWSLVEKLRVHGTISGVLNIAYYNTAVSDNIINDFQNFKLNQSPSFVNIVTDNYNNILDMLFTIFTIMGYNIYKKTRVQKFILASGELYQDNYYINEFKEFRKISATLTLITLVIFSKSVQNAT